MQGNCCIKNDEIVIFVILAEKLPEGNLLPAQFSEIGFLGTR